MTRLRLVLRCRGVEWHHRVAAGISGRRFPTVAERSPFSYVSWIRRLRHVRPDIACTVHALSARVEAMDTTVVQVRDLPTDVVATLKARAQARGQSLTAYLRDLLTDEAAKPPIEDVMAAIATRTPVSYSADDLRDMIEDGRR